MDSLTYFYSKNVHFYTPYSYSLKVTALAIFQNEIYVTSPLP